MKSHNSYECIFVVLCYRNTEDLYSFIKSTASLSFSFKIIVVNSYYDDETKEKFKQLAETHDCDFINVPNRGYGAGNNVGIEYALQHYSFHYLTICNPDIEFISFPIVNNKKDIELIIAPKIKTLKGKLQNPFLCYYNLLSEWLEYVGFKRHNLFLLYCGFAINKLLRVINLLVYRARRRTIYAAHGACLIIGKAALEKLGAPYDENMFLFCEEFYLAKQAYDKNIKTVYDPLFEILHKEDGSVSLISQNTYDIQAKSFIYYYEKYIK